MLFRFLVPVNLFSEKDDRWKNATRVYPLPQQKSWLRLFQKSSSLSALTLLVGSFDPYIENSNFMNFFHY